MACPHSLPDNSPVVLLFLLLEDCSLEGVIATLLQSFWLLQMSFKLVGAHDFPVHDIVSLLLESRFELACELIAEWRLFERP